MPASSSNQMLTINGSNFASNATLTFDPPTGANIPSNASKLTFVSSSRITYEFNNAGDAGTWTVRVNNPDGMSSVPVEFSVTGTSGSSKDDYPARWANAPLDRDVVDDWNFYARQCTSYVAWRMNRDRGITTGKYYFHNLMTGPNGVAGRWSNAIMWDENARVIGFVVDRVPAVGAIAQWNIGEFGHVAYVESVNADNTVNVSEYNYFFKTRPGTWSERFNVTPDWFIHINDQPTTSAPTIERVSPASLEASASNQTITIVGTNFDGKSTLTFDPPTGANLNSNPAKLTFNSSTQLTYEFNSGGDVGTWTVTVNNPGSGSSNLMSFTITAASPAPTITGVSPAAVVATNAPQILTIDGRNFVADATLTLKRPGGTMVNGNARDVNVVSSDQIVFAFTADETGNWTVSVNNPDGESSNTGGFTVLAVGQTVEVNGAVPINEDFIPVGRANRPGTRMEPRYVTIHETDNTQRGADAANHADYLKGAAAAGRPASWHFSVDDTEIYQHLRLDETAWHAGDGEAGTGNRESIAIEICQNVDGNRARAEENAAWLAAKLLNQLGLSLGAVKQHNHWTGKDCPRNIRARARGWDDFLERVAYYKSNGPIAVGEATELSTTALETSSVSWKRNGVALPEANGATFALDDVQPKDVGLYTAEVDAGGVITEPRVVGIATPLKVVGDGKQVGADIIHPNGKVFDQVLIEGQAAVISADNRNVTRTSFIDLNDDILQIEFSGAGNLSLALEAASGPATPVRYHQPTVAYMKGHAGIIITGADETTNVSVFSVGRATAFDPTGAFNFLQPVSATNDPANNGNPLFTGHEATEYDGVADLAFIAITSPSGRFGGVRAANARFWSSHGFTGLYAPGVRFAGPVFIGDLNAYDSATAVLRLGGAADVRITGGTLSQENRGAIEVSGISELTFSAGSDSHGAILPASTNHALFHQNGQDVTEQIVPTAAGSDMIPEEFAFTDVSNAEPDTYHVSNPVTVTGITAAAPISVAGGSYSINGGVCTTASGVINNGDRVTVRLRSSAIAATKTAATLTIGGVSGPFTVTTRSGAATYSVIASADGNGTITPSGTQTVSGGASATFTAAPASGWAVGQWLVNGNVAANGTSSYTVANVTVNTTVQVTFVAQTASGSSLVSGEAKEGAITTGGRGIWTMTAAAGESLVLRVGKLSGTSNFAPSLQLHDPSGALVRWEWDDSDAMLTHQVAEGGTYTIVVASFYTGGNGTYRLHAVRAPGPLTVATGDEGGALVSGGAQEGSLTIGDLDAWIVTAGVGESIVVRMGKLSGTSSFAPDVLLYDPSGSPVHSEWDDSDAMLTHQAAVGGTYTVVVSSFYSGGTGGYKLHAVKIPNAFVTPAGDEGGALTNGGAHEGTITIGDLDAWTVTAGVGESIVVRMGKLSGTSSFSPYLRLYDPSGAPVRSEWDDSDAMLTHQATVGGTYTVVVSSFYSGGTGGYKLHAVKIPNAFVTPAGDEGGALTNGGAHEGTITIGDLDAWTVTAGVGESIVVRMGKLSGTSSFSPYLRLYDPSGAPVRSSWDDSDAMLTHRASIGGSYTLVGSSFYSGGAGAYRLHVVKAPGGLAIPAGDEGGSFTPGTARDGAVTIGDLDAWTINAASGASLQVHIEKLAGTSSFAPYVLLYDPLGAFVRSDWDDTRASITYQSGQPGLYTVVVCSFYSGATGTYRIK